MLRPVEQMTHIQTIEDDSLHFNSTNGIGIGTGTERNKWRYNVKMHKTTNWFQSRIGPGQNGINCQPLTAVNRQRVRAPAPNKPYSCADISGNHFGKHEISINALSVAMNIDWFDMFFFSKWLHLNKSHKVWPMQKCIQTRNNFPCVWFIVSFKTRTYNIYKWGDDRSSLWGAQTMRKRGSTLHWLFFFLIFANWPLFVKEKNRSWFRLDDKLN